MLSVKRVVSVAVAAIILASCGGSSSNEANPTTVATDADTATTLPVSTTAPAPSTTVAVDEDVVKCPTSTFSAQFKTKMRMLDCTTTWAVGRYDRDTWNCPSDGCIDARIFHLENNVWVDKATCYTTEPLIPGKRRCYVPDVGVATDADLPPAVIACKIWPLNTDPKWADEAGCPLTDAAVNRILSTACDGWNQNESLPISPCDSGSLVRTVQKALRDAGFSVQVDGFNGPGTVRAIAQFQQDKGLRRSGIVNEETFAALAGN